MDQAVDLSRGVQNINTNIHIISLHFLEVLNTLILRCSILRKKPIEGAIISNITPILGVPFDNINSVRR